MTTTFAAIRAAFFAGAFLYLWGWIALWLRRFDPTAGGLLPEWTRPLGIVALALGGALAASCVVAFVVRGQGTPAPFDPPRRLVAAGPYRFSRNPMYVGGALLLLGLGLHQRSPAIILFLPWWMALFQLIVVLYEEPALRAKFGPGYDEYRRRVPRWIPWPKWDQTQRGAALVKR